MRIALIFEIEELLFDTRSLRAHAMHQALAREGVIAAYDDVERAHAGWPAALALGRVAAADTLDDVGRDLVLRRVADSVAESISRDPPSFSPAARDVLETLAADFPLAVVTRAERGDAQRLLELAGLDACVTTIRSVADIAPGAQHTVWSDAQRRLHAERGVAFAPGPLLAGASRAGLSTVQVGDGPEVACNARLASLAPVNASFIASLF